MKVKFKSNCSAYGYGYSGGSIHDLPKDFAACAIKDGAAIALEPEKVERAVAKKAPEKAIKKRSKK